MLRDRIYQMMWRRRHAYVSHAQRGDTLVEVAIALAILAGILVSSYTLAASAFRVGVSAKERTQAANFVQEQGEALRNLRDSSTWSQFVAATAVTPSFYLTPSGGSPSSWSVVTPDGRPTINGKASLFRIWVTRENTAESPDKYRFVIRAEWEANSSGAATNHTDAVLDLVNPQVSAYVPSGSAAVPMLQVSWGIMGIKPDPYFNQPYVIAG